MDNGVPPTDKRTAPQVLARDAATSSPGQPADPRSEGPGTAKGNGVKGGVNASGKRDADGKWKNDESASVEYENEDSPGALRYTEPRAALVSKYARLVGAPIVTDLKSVGGVGVAGQAGLAEAVARAVVAQVVALHAPTEVVLACLTSTVGRSRWQWAEWLPHAASQQSPFGALQLAGDAATRCRSAPTC